MSSTLKLLIISSAFCVVLCNFNVRDDVPWFRERLRVKDKFLGGILRGRNTICTVNRAGTATRGVCKPLKECLLLGGTSGGLCNLLGTCCIIERSCFNTTSQKVSYFVNPTNFQPRCPLTVNLFSRDVCQIRLDFEGFSLSGPAVLDLDGVVRCPVDSFTVNGAFSNNGFQFLCGLNDNQHIYIPVNGTQGNNGITLNFDLLFRNSTTLPVSVANPTWRIRITQLECSPNSFSDFSNIQSALVSLYQQIKNKKNNNNNVNADAALIAPNGCLQYYTERTGSYESFNYNGGAGPYLPNLNYAICFRRNLETCGIRHTAEFFRMNENPGALQDVHCTALADPNTENLELSQDYITIPGSTNNAGGDIYCNEDIPANTPINSNSPGPLYVSVRTDNIQANTLTVSESGFRFNYEVLSTGCL